MLDVRRNGTGVPLPINTVDIELDAMGYPGWMVTMRTNPRASVYDDFVAVDDMARWWHAFGLIVQRWNFADEDGLAFPQPREIASEADLDLPVGVIAYIYRCYLEEFRTRVGLPKVPDANSETTFRTSGASSVTE